MSYHESRYYADPHLLLMVDALETQHGEYSPVEVGYAYKIGRGKSQTIKSSLHTSDHQNSEQVKQLLYEADELEFWPYPGTNPHALNKATTKLVGIISHYPVRAASVPLRPQTVTSPLHPRAGPVHGTTAPPRLLRQSI